jgi:hypothetical protein
MTLMIGLHIFFFKCLKNVGQDSVSRIVHSRAFLWLNFPIIFKVEGQRGE